MRVEIRRVAANEGPLLMSVRLLALLDAPYAFASTYTDSIQRPTQEWAARAARASAGGSEVIFLARIEGGEPVGMAGGFTPETDSRSRMIWGVWVEPALRGQELGRHLVDAVVAWAETVGADQTELWVAESNTPAMRLYRSLGFVASGDRQPMPSDPTVTEERLVRPTGRGPSA